MTDNEIIMCLKWLIADYETNKPADFKERLYKMTDCKIMQRALDLISRQKAKIEALQMDNKQLENDNFNANMNCEVLQAENERLKKFIELMEGAKCAYSYDGETVEYCIKSPCPNFKTEEQIKTEARKEVLDLLISMCDAPHWCVWLSELCDLAEKMEADNKK